MTTHAKQRLRERYNMSYKRFIISYRQAIKDKKFFKKDYQDPDYPGLRVCVLLDNKILIVVALDVKGMVKTIFTPQQCDYDKAYELGIL